jgi:type IV secretion system protein VirD4
LAEVRLRTPHEIRDVRNIAQMIMDPNGKGLPDHWLRAGVEGFTGFTLAQLYEGRDPTLSGIEARPFRPYSADQPDAGTDYEHGSRL